MAVTIRTCILAGLLLIVLYLAGGFLTSTFTQYSQLSTPLLVNAPRILLQTALSAKSAKSAKSASVLQLTYPKTQATTMEKALYLHHSQ